MNNNTPLDRIYNMLFSVGINNLNAMPAEIIKDCLYKINKHYYIIKVAELDKDENKHSLYEAIRSKDKIFIDGWTASINMNLKHYKEDIKIMF